MSSGKRIHIKNILKGSGKDVLTTIWEQEKVLPSRNSSEQPLSFGPTKLGFESMTKILIFGMR